MRTNIDIDDELMRQAMVATNTTTKKAAVEASLRKLIEAEAREKSRVEAMAEQEKSRLAAIRDGHLNEWHEQLVRTGTFNEEFDHANQH
jgi:Arc/MetJ family transcription regulator